MAAGTCAGRLYPGGGPIMDKELAGQVADIAHRVVASGAISANGHGNVSVRVPGAEEMYFTAGPSLRDHPASMVVRVGLDGTLLEGDLPPIQGAVVAMHTAMYADDPDVGCVLHTHSPYATAYAVARRPIGCWVEALAMFGLPGGVPVAGYRPRGIRRSCRQHPGRGDPRGASGAAGRSRMYQYSTARRSSPSWLAPSSRRQRRRASTPAGWAGQPRSRKTSRPQPCNGPWPSISAGPYAPDRHPACKSISLHRR